MNVLIQRTTFGFGIFAAASVPGAALAQLKEKPALENKAVVNPQGSLQYQPLANPRDPRGAARTYQQIINFGRCVAKTGKDRAAKFLATAPNSQDEKFEFTTIMERYRPCGSFGVTTGISLMRGAVAEGLLARMPETSGSSAEAVRVSFDTTLKAQNATRHSDEIALVDATSCLVRSAPRDAAAVIASPHGTGAEDTAFDKLFAAAPSCVGANPFGFLTPSYMRSFIAEQLYDWNVAAAKTRAS